MEFARRQIRRFGDKPTLGAISTQMINRGLLKDFVVTTCFSVDLKTQAVLNETHQVITRRSSALFHGRGWDR